MRCTTNVISKLLVEFKKLGTAITTWIESKYGIYLNWLKIEVELTEKDKQTDDVRKSAWQKAICRTSAQTYHLLHAMYEDVYSLCDWKSLSLLFGKYNLGILEGRLKFQRFQNMNYPCRKTPSDMSLEQRKQLIMFKPDNIWKDWKWNLWNRNKSLSNTRTMDEGNIQEDN